MVKLFLIVTAFIFFDISNQY